jgi:hypothetical protein
LTENNIDDDGAGLLRDFLSVHSGIARLELNQSRIDCRSAVSLDDALCVNLTPTHIHLDRAASQNSISDAYAGLGQSPQNIAIGYMA